MSVAAMSILIVEDDADNARLLELALRSSRHGSFSCVRALSLAQAIERLKGGRIDVVLLDLTLPDSRGLETLARVRTQSRNVPIVILTGMSDQAAAVRALQEGAQDYLVKGQVDGDAVARSVRYVFERTRAEREHAATRIRLELVAENVQLGIWEWDLATDRLKWTKPMAEMFGVEHLDGPSTALHRFIKPEDPIALTAMIEKALIDRTVYQRQFRIVRDDGRVLWVESRGRGVYDETTDQPMKVIGTMVDVTARREAEEAARERESTVAHLARVSLVGQMASGLAHELNQPLSAILNFGAAGQSQLKATPPNLAGADKAIREVMDEARRAGQIIKRIKGFLRKQEPKVTALDVNQTVKRSVELIRFEIERANVRTTVTLADGLPQVAADEVQVEQVLVNLIYNAIDAMRQYPAAERHIGLYTVLDPATPDHVSVVVTDTGHGIPAEVAERLFEPFYTTKANGLGMGLNLSRTIIERMGGVIRASRNKTGRGTSFVFTLPITGDITSDGVGPQSDANTSVEVNA